MQVHIYAYIYILQVHRHASSFHRKPLGLATTCEKRKGHTSRFGCWVKGLKVLCSYLVTALSKFALLRYLSEIRFQALFLFIRDLPMNPEQFGRSKRLMVETETSFML